MLKHFQNAKITLFMAEDVDAVEKWRQFVNILNIDWYTSELIV